jgi:hypothetical protein
LEKHRLDLEQALHQLDDELEARLGRARSQAEEPARRA